jgi:hypothetical protein
MRGVGRALGLGLCGLLCLMFTASAAQASDPTCPSTWGFDGAYYAGLNPADPLPGWFGGVTDCDVALQSFDNWSTVTDEASGATVASTARYSCGSANTGCATWGIGAESVFAPVPGHSYRGDYFVVMQPRPGLTWITWPSDCTADGTRTVLSCDYHSGYATGSTLNQPAVGTAVARAG